MARPTKYRKIFCQMLEDHMKEGDSLNSFAAKIGIHEGTLYDWFNRFPEFAESKKKGEDLSLHWWEDKAKRLALGNPTMMIFLMKNRFNKHYNDRKQIEHSGRDGGPIELQNMTEEEILIALAALEEENEKLQ